MMSRLQTKTYRTIDIQDKKNTGAPMVSNERPNRRGSRGRQGGCFGTNEFTSVCFGVKLARTGLGGIGEEASLNPRLTCGYGCVCS